MDAGDGFLTAADVDRLVEALGEAPRVTYAPSGIYPMSAPVFEAAPALEREVPVGAPVGVYAHVPFCNYKCTFCFYATRPTSSDEFAARYVAAVERELERIPEGAPLTQLYVGGGTPTALPPALLDRLLHAAFARVRRAPQGEGEVHTVECSPESVTREHVRAVRAHGVERMSMGVQTNDVGVLTRTNRRHDAGQVRAAAELLVGEGLVVNVDLIYGLPGQAEESFRADFEAVAALGVHSVTCYNLRVNEKTPIGRSVSPEERLDAARLVRWRRLALDVARGVGFEQTRWHTFRRVAPATAAGAARRFRDVTGRGNQVGAGNSARSRLGDVVYRNHREVDAYLERVEGGRSPVEEARRLDATDRRLRHVALTLGDGAPLERSEYLRDFGTSVDDDFADAVERTVAAGVVVDEGQRLRLTERGRLVYDLVTRAFYPAPVRRWMDERQRLADTEPNLRPRAATPRP